LAAAAVYITYVAKPATARGNHVEEMGLLDRLKAVFSEGPRLIDELAELAGRSEALVARMRRHAEMCAYGTIAQGVREIADREAAHEKALRAILADRGLWPRPPAAEPHDGTNNWERLSGDLNALLAFAQELHRHALRWEGANPALAKQLFQIADEAAVDEMELRRLTAKCDPQALD
jgi:hypothetical protein